jgi:serine/threonine protein kinase
VVARARDEQLRTIVAVKLLRSRDPDLQRRFAREAEVLANIQHPSIVRVLAHGREADELYMALELIDGPNLAQRLAAAGPLPWRQVLEIGIQIADALDVVHGKGLIHRDVKPANIMLAEGGEHPHVKLIDFGYARLTEEYRDPTGFTPDPRRRTDLGLAIGTPGYLPLEAGLVPADERFDIYGLGVTLYELLTGELPGIEPIRPLREVNPVCDAPDDLGLVLAAALALEPGDRTQSAAELRRALEAIRTAHPEPSRPCARLDGRYELLSVLGTGAKGDVYLANHRGCGHDVALKLLRSTHPDDLRRFEREAKLLALLDAPGLPRFFDYAPLAERPYIAMACAPGVPAVRFCLASDKIRLRPTEVIEVGRQLAQVLALLHERGVLHRDINANNVMIELGRTPRVTLIDLGCAALGASFYTHASLRYRTPPEARVEIPDGGIEQLAWSAPEVRAGAGWSDKSDVYALGWLLYRLITGKLPTRSDGDTPVPVHKVALACPADLARIVLQTLQPRPDDRPTAAQLVSAFQDMLEDEAAVEQAEEPSAQDWPPASPALAPQPAAAPSAPRPPRRRGGVLLAAVAALCAWWVGRATAPTSKDILPARPTMVSAIPTTASEIDARPDSPPPTAPPPAPRPVLPAMRAALDAVAPQLRGCGSKAGLFIEFTIEAGRDQFASITVIGDHEEHVDRCVRAAVADLRFAPTTAQIVHEAYTP